MLNFNLKMEQGEIINSQLKFGEETTKTAKKSFFREKSGKIQLDPKFPSGDIGCRK